MFKGNGLDMTKDRKFLLKELKAARLSIKEMTAGCTDDERFEIGKAALQRIDNALGSWKIRSMNSHLARIEFERLVIRLAIECDYHGSITNPKTANVTQCRITLHAPAGFIFNSTHTACDDSICSEINFMCLDWDKAFASLKKIVAKGFEKSDATG